MTLQNTGPISIGDINEELGFSRTRNSSLGETAFRDLAGVPSGTIKMSDFYGKAAFTPGFVDSSGNSVSTDGLLVFEFAFAGFTLETNAQVTVSQGFGELVNRWGVPVTTGIGSSFEANFDNASGFGLTLPSAGSWIALSTARTATYQEGNGGASFRVRIRPNGGSVASTLDFSFTDSSI